MQRIPVKDVLAHSAPGSMVTACGWVRTRRDSKGGFSFIALNDGSCLASLQVVAEKGLENYEREILKLYPGSSISVTGEVVQSQGSGQSVELRATSIHVFGFSDPMHYTLGKQKVSMETLREVAHLRPRTNTFGAVMRVRNALSFATHRFFQERGFFYLHSPIITASDCEGAGAMFQVTTLDMANPPRNPQGAIDYQADFFGRRACLTVSGQLEGETYACALSSIYTFGPTFRAENSNTRRHLAEFWMVEPEIAFADINDDATLAEEYLRYCFKYVLDHCAADLAFFNERVDDTHTLLPTIERLAQAAFVRISYDRAVDILCKSGQKFEFTPSWGCDLQTEHEQYLTEKAFDAPVIVTGYPRDIKAFYMRSNDDGRTVAAMDVLIPGVGEIIGGSQREERLDVLERRMRELGLKPEDYWWYLDLRRFGTVPHAGFGLGFERLVQFCSGMHNIRDVIPYPRTPGCVDF